VVTVIYPHECNYRDLGTGRVPVLALSISFPSSPQNTIDVDAYLDSGAERSLFNGFIIPALGGDLLNDNTKPYSSTTGDEIIGYVHRVRLAVPEVGNFELEFGFSDRSIRRNLLGRDFFNLFQIGFRERQLQYYLNTTP
jgi:hypothetical protein